MNVTTQSPSPHKAGRLEFIILMAALSSLAAVATDAMLPALYQIGVDLKAPHENDAQLILALIFIGMALGQLLFGPMADSLGRKTSMLAGIGLFMVGSAITVAAQDFTWMLVGRVVQGIGLGAPRTVCMAIIRDEYRGREMARIMSNIMSIFIVVPMVAPMSGQLILYLTDSWRYIFVLLWVLSASCGVWFYARIGETLKPENRIPFSFKEFGSSIWMICRHPVVMLYTLACGLVFACLICYLSGSPKVFQHLYDAADEYVFIFAFLAFAIGLASHLNSRWVVRLGMQAISRFSTCALMLVSLVFGFASWFYGGVPPLWMTVTYLFFALFALGGLFGNLNALAMEPLTQGAGIGAMMIGTLSTFISVPVGAYVARQIDATMHPVAIGFFLCSFGVFWLLFIAEKISGRLTSKAETLV